MVEKQFTVVDLYRGINAIECIRFALLEYQKPKNKRELKQKRKKKVKEGLYGGWWFGLCSITPSSHPASESHHHAMHPSTDSAQ